MTRHLGHRRHRICRGPDIGIDERQDGSGWPVGDVRLSSITTSDVTHYLLVVPQAVLDGEALTSFLGRLAPFGCPPPGSLIRAYSLPDAPYPSILLREHEQAPEGTGEAYRRFVDRARGHWLTALQETGPGLCPVLAWQAESSRRFLTPGE